MITKPSQPTSHTQVQDVCLLVCLKLPSLHVPSSCTCRCPSLSPLSSDDPLSSDSTVVPEPLFPSLSSTLVVAASVKRNNFGKLTPGRCFGQKTIVVELFHLAHPYFGMTFS